MNAGELTAVAGLALAIFGAVGAAFVDIRGRRLFYTRAEGENVATKARQLPSLVERVGLIESELNHQRDDMTLRVVEPLEKITARLEAIANTQNEQSRLLVQHAERSRALGRSVDELRERLDRRPA